MNSLKNISRTHSEKVRARYARGERYSVEATKLKRKKNHQRWLRKAKLKYGQRFDYSSTAQDYETQKNPPVRIKCLRHNKTFTVLPDKHMQNQHGGCSACSEEASRSTRLESEREKFENWFNDNRSDRLTIVSEFQGMTTELIVFCKIHNSEKTLIPSSFMHQNGYGCDTCAAEATGASSRLKLSDAKAALANVLPQHISVEAVRYDENLRLSLIQVHCKKHQTSSWERMGHIKRSPHICRVCGEGRIGFASNRLRRLLEYGERGETASIAVMEVEALGIEALKVGVTTRSLNERYAHHLKTTFFEARLFEIDAYVLENQIKIEFGDHKDERIIKAGMRGGSRWSGDTELYWFRQRQPIIAFIKKFLKEIKKQVPNYEFELGRMVIPTPFPVSHDREKSELNRPVAVVGVDPKTNEVKEKYDTISEARANGYRNVSLVISGKSNRQTCGGLRWFRAEKFKSDTVPAMEPAKIGLPVFCKERNQHFLSAMDAERSLRQLGFEITGSHISSVINGKRQMAGGLTWSYSPLSRLDIQNQKPGDIIDYRPARNRNSPHPVKLIKANDPLTTSHYGSMSEAARSINTSAGNISKALKTGKSIKGFFVEIL